MAKKTEPVSVKGVDTHRDRWAQCSQDVRLPDGRVDFASLFLFEEKRKVQKHRLAPSASLALILTRVAFWRALVRTDRGQTSYMNWRIPRGLSKPA